MAQKHPQPDPVPLGDRDLRRVTGGTGDVQAICPQSPNLRHLWERTDSTTGQSRCRWCGATQTPQG